MKELGGVGAVVLGGMLLLTIKIGPAERGLQTVRPEAAPRGAMAAVAQSPAKPAPAPEISAAPRPVRVCLVAPSPEKAAPRSLPEREIGKAAERETFQLVVKTVEGALTLTVPREATRL